MEVGQFFIYLFSIIIGGAGAWMVSVYGHRMSLTVQPNERSSHRHATPNGGGVGIMASFIAVALVFKLPVTFWMPAALLSVVSLFGDRFEISFLIRLAVQFSAAFILLFGLGEQQTAVTDNYLILTLAAIFIVGTANYYNFMDGINGIAGITGIVGFGLLAIITHNDHAGSNMFELNVALVLGCVGFLPFNFPRARVFMGDVGSILLGFVFAAMVVSCSKSLLDFLCYASFLFPFYADEITTAIVRLKDHEKLWQPHRRHLYQLLANECRIDHWKVSIGYGIGQLAVGLSVLAFRNQGLLTFLSLMGFYFLIFIMLSNVIRKKVAALVR